MAKNIRCSITITEMDGKLAVLANIPDGTEDSIAGVLTRALIEQSAALMNEILGENQVVEKMTSQ